MNLVRIDQAQIDPPILAKAVKLLKAEDLVIHPTETVYGIAGRYDSERVLQAISRIKMRPLNQPFSIMVESVDQMMELSGQQSHWLDDVLSRLFPNPLTILIPRKNNLGISFWNQFPLLGFRCPAHLWSSSLVQQTGFPLITTSANVSGERPATTINEIAFQMLSQIPLVLDGGTTRYQFSSTIIEIEPGTSSFKLIRAGTMSWEEINDLISH